MADPPGEDAPPVDTAECPECHAVVSGRGGMRATVYLGLHRKKEHGYQPPPGTSHRKGSYSSNGRPRGRPRKTAAPEEAEVTRLSLIQDARDELGEGKKPPTVDQLTRALGKALGYTSVWRASQLVDGDPRIGSEEAETAAIEMLSATVEESRAIAHPPARLLAASKLNATVGKTLVEHSDVLDAGYALLEIGGRQRRYMRARRAWEKANTPIEVGPVPLTPETVRQAQTSPTSPPPTRGIVVTPDMVHGNGGGPATIANAQEEY